MIPRITTNPREQACQALTYWDASTAVLQTSFAYPEPTPVRTPPLRERIDHSLGIQPPSHRVVLGPVDIILDGANRLELIETRTSPAQWRKETLPGPLRKFPWVWIDFQVEYDINYIATLDVPVTILWDPSGEHLLFRFHPPSTKVQRYAVANTVTVGVEQDGTLSEFGFQNIAILSK
jgi:hypothetical protein